MSFALDIVRNIVAHRSVEIPDPIIDRWVFGDRVPSPLPGRRLLLVTVERMSTIPPPVPPAGAIEEVREGIWSIVLPFHAHYPGETLTYLIDLGDDRPVVSQTESDGRV